MSNVIPFNYKGQAVQFNADGWINATSVAKEYGKRPVDWLKQDETKQYLAALADALNCDPESLLETRRGRYNSGTWLHPKLGVRFAQWLDLRFAVWCDLRVDALLRGDANVRQQFDTACKNLEDGRDRASQGGRELARWRWGKQPLEQRANYWREQLQMTLSLERTS